MLERAPSSVAPDFSLPTTLNHVRCRPCAYGASMKTGDHTSTSRSGKRNDAGMTPTIV
jgi:hypothetical protein